MPYRQNVCTYCRIYCDTPFSSCPICGRELESQYNVNGSYRRYGSSEETSHNDSPRGGGFFTDDRTTHTRPSPTRGNERDNSEKKSERTSRRRHIEGVIHALQPFNNDDRMIFTRIYDSIRFGTVNSTVGYSFRVSQNSSDGDVEVVCYGVTASRSAKLANGESVRVVGSENRYGVVMARSIYVNGNRVRLVDPGSDSSAGGGFNIVLAIVVLILLLVGAAFFIPAVRDFIAVLLTMMVVAEIGFIAIRPLRSLAVRPIPIVVVGGILTALMYNVGGIASILGAYIYALAPLAIIIIGIIMLIRSVL